VSVFIDPETGELVRNDETMIAIDDVVLDAAIYPRGSVSSVVVSRYAEAYDADEPLPPIVLEVGTRRLLDGRHRLGALRQLGRTHAEVRWESIPDGIPPKLWCAAYSTRHGHTIAEDDLRAVATDVLEAAPEMPVAEIAKLIGRPRRTVQDWLAEPLAERAKRQESERRARSYAVALLGELGWSQRQIAAAVGVSLAQVSRIGDSAGTEHLDESDLRAGLALVPAEALAGAEALAAAWRRDRMFAHWTDEERRIRQAVEDDGETVVVSYRIHKDLIAYLEAAGLFVRIDRRSDWGNPFEMPGDGDRATVIRNFAEHYLPHKPSLHSRYGELVGKALGCWCSPEPCHGDVLREACQ